MKFTLILLGLVCACFPAFSVIDEITDGATKLSTGTPSFVLAVVAIGLCCVVCILYRNGIKDQKLYREEWMIAIKANTKALSNVERAVEKCHGHTK